MTYTYRFKAKFAGEFARLPQDQQDLVFDFTDLYEQHGLGDFTKFPGKITPSWSGLDEGTRAYIYTHDNCLWHYHIGYPEYKVRFHEKYKTSDWVLHFQWLGKGTHIELVDMYQHLDYDGNFWLPKPEYLVEPEVAEPAVKPVTEKPASETGSAE